VITIPWQMVLLCSVSLCVGWGIRGNFGHEYGAALPGALAAIAIVLLSGREDWWRYVHHFALFGAIGNQFLFAEWLWRVPIWGFVVMVGTTFAFWGIKHALYGKQHAPGASLHIRFGKDSNTPREKPKAGKPHP
jgi:hypothetical protein